MADAPPGLLARGHADTVLRASQVSRFAVAAPSVAASTAAAFVLALVELGVFALGPARLDLPEAAAASLVGLLAPALLFAGATFNFYRHAGGTITARRASTLALTDLAAVCAFTLAGSVLPSASGDAWKWAVLAGTAFASSVNMIVLAGTADPSLSRALAPSLTFPALSFAALFGLAFITPTQFYLAFLFVLLFVAAAALWIHVVIAPFRRNFHENGLELLHAVLDAWAGWSRDTANGAASVGTLKMEAFFARHGQPRQVRFDGLLLSQGGGRKLLWFLPELHPGPYADLGGSDLPAKAAAHLEGLAAEVAVFHGASTHDENPSGREQLAKLLAPVKPALEAAERSAKATKSVRESEEPFTVTAQRIGRTLVVAQSRAPRSSDDIELALGREITGSLERSGSPHAMLLDGHNSVDADLGRICAGSAEGGALKALCLKAAQEVAALEEEPLAVGWAAVALAEPDRIEYAVGRRGILATVTEAARQKTAWVLIDGNNLKSPLRAEMLDALRGKVDHAEVFTTDNHAVNTTMGADNEVGSSHDNARLIAMVAAAVDRAVADLKPAEAASVTGRVEDIQVFGPGLTVKMSATINAAVSVMIPAYLATTAAALIACVALAVLLS